MPLSDNLIAAWELNEASGNALDSHGANTLTDQNTVGSGTGLIYGAARDFEADSTEYFSRADNADLSFGDVDVTWEVWVKTETSTGFPVVFSKGPSGDREYILYLATDTPNWQVGSGTVAWSGTLTPGTWYQIICWHDSVNNQLGIVVNAGTPATASHALGGVDSTNDFQLGAAPTQSLYWDGLIGPCRFWKRVLTSAERTELYNAGAGRTYAYITGGGGDVTPPTLSGAATNTAGTAITATLSESGCVADGGGSSGTGGFTLSGTTATVASWAISGTTLTLTLSGTITSSETVTYSYARASTTDDIKDAAGNYLADFSGAAVTNNVTSGLAAGTASFVSSGPAGITVSATAPSGGTGAGPTYQWERNEDGGAYSDLTGETALTCEDSTATTAGVLYGFRCKQTRGVETVTTNAVTAQAYQGGAIGGGASHPFRSALIQGVG